MAAALGVHVFDELRCSLGLRQYNQKALARKRKLEEETPRFSLCTGGWRDMAPPKPEAAWTRAPMEVLEALVGESVMGLKSQYDTCAPCSEEVGSQLQLLHAATLAEGGLLQTAWVIAAESGRDELEPADLTDAARRATTGAVDAGRLAAAATVMAGLLTESRALDDSPRRQAIVESVTDFIAQLNSASWPPGITMGGSRIARLVEALLRLPCESLSSYTMDVVCSTGTRALALAEERLRVTTRVLLAERGGLLSAARDIAAERGRGEGDAADDLIAAGQRVLPPEPTSAQEALRVTLEGIDAAAEMLADWLRKSAAQAGGSLSFCETCGFALPCPWGC